MNLNFKFILFILLASVSLSSLSSSLIAAEPDSADIDSNNQDSNPKPKEKSDDKSIKLANRSLNSEVTLCDGRLLKGKSNISLPDTLTLTHTVDGLEFIKKVRISEIQSIEFERWLPNSEGDRRREGKVYRFDVSRFRVELVDSTTLSVQRPLPNFLQKLTFSNKNGEVLLYSFWMDLLKSDNTWYTGIQGPPSGERHFCHKDVIRKIRFIQ